MRVALFSARPYDRRSFEAANAEGKLSLHFFEAHLEARTAALADGFDVVCPFVNDVVDAGIAETLAAGGTRLLALRSAGYNHVDLAACERHGITVARVPAYSPHAVAEHTLTLILALNRHIHRAHNRVREGNFSLDGLLGFDLNGQTAGVVGTGRIGVVVARILAGFGCRVLAFDPYPNDEVARFGATYVELETLFAESNIVTLHCPLSPATHHLVDAAAIGRMRDDVMLINTSRGALIDTRAVIAALKQGKIGYLGLDVYEEEADLFFEDLSDRIITDDVFARLQTFPNVLITGHQAFFTREALSAIADTTIDNITAFAQGRVSGNEITVESTQG